MTSFTLKIIACITMFIDHLGYIIFHKFSYFNYIGRLAFPIFAFQISEGFVHTKNLKKYFLRIGLFAIISQIPFHLFHATFSNEFSLNVFFTLFLGLLAIYVYDKISYKPLGLAIAFAISYVANIIKADYGYFGVLLVFCFYLFKDNHVLTLISFFILLLLKYVPNMVKYNFYGVYALLFLCTFSAIIPIFLYNKKQGKKIKYFLYIFYPVHLLILYGLSFIF